MYTSVSNVYIYFWNKQFCFMARNVLELPTEMG